jgi:hypothetical protein
MRRGYLLGFEASELDLQYQSLSLAANP